MPAAPLRFVLCLTAALCAAVPAFAQDPEVVPEDPLPPPPPELPIAPVGPVATAPDARDLLKECDEEAFTDCFRLWRPPPPPEPEPPSSEPASTAGIPPGAPREPAVGGAASTPGPPPPAPTAEDQATYDALVRAMKETGLDGKILLPPPPLGGAAPPAAQPPQKAPKSP